MSDSDNETKGSVRGLSGPARVIWLCPHCDRAMRSDSNDPVVCASCDTESTWVESAKVWRVDGGVVSVVAGRADG